MIDHLVLSLIVDGEPNIVEVINAIANGMTLVIAAWLVRSRGQHDVVQTDRFADIMRRLDTLEDAVDQIIGITKNRKRPRGT